MSCCAVALALLSTASPVVGQTSERPEGPSRASAPPSSPPPARRAAPPASARDPDAPAPARAAAATPRAGSTPAQRSRAASPVAGQWTGTVKQVDHELQYTVNVTVTDTGGETEYPELSCAGKLTRIGASGGYVHYHEKITKGQFGSEGGRCADDVVIVARVGDKLGWVSFTAQGTTNVVTHATLTRRAGR
jgi:hypothetical protein